ncbi:MAG: response regulator [Treponema sp.]|jgi:signal transduction histidine kinase/CheY-like chemotaxis protein|nr:response regulator [Treponema sp.]
MVKKERYSTGLALVLRRLTGKTANGRIEKHTGNYTVSPKILETIFNSIDEFVYVSDPQTCKLLFINEQMKKLFNLKGNEGIGDYCYKVFRKLNKKCEFCPCDQLNKDPDKTIVWEEHDSNIERDIRHRDSYINWPDGTKVHMQHIIDITDIKRITEEKINAEREAQKLIQKKEQAEEALRMKSAFLADISHEIRTPIHGIIGFSDLVLDDNISLNTRNYISKIKTSAENLLQVINDILDISKIEAGKADLEKKPFDIDEILNLCRIIITPKAHEKGLSFYCYTEPLNNILLIGDPVKLRQVLIHLLSNSINYTNTGMVKLLVNITKKTENGITIYFEVKDSGAGMTKEQISSIFQPYEQDNENRKISFGIIGLGLTITRNFIELMGGVLKIESTPGLGSKFSFEITFETKEKPDYTEEIIESKPEEKPVFNGEVLVCEDNVLNQQVILSHLSRVGLRTVVAPNGKIGVDTVKSRMEKNEKPFDLIIMDIRMPEMDGIEAAKKIIEAGCTTPIIALTVNTMAHDKVDYFAAGMKDCISKPFTSKELWTCLFKYLEPVTMISKKSDAESTEEEEQRIEMISTFIKYNQTTLEDINKALAAGGIQQAYRLVHTLKGVAGMIGMTMLANAAFSIEQSLTEGNTEYLNDKMKTLEYELNAALNELTHIANDYYTKKANKKISEGIFNKNSILNLLKTLDSLLETCSFDSLNLLDDLKSIPGTETLIEQIENIKFKQARETLTGVRQKYGE